MAIPELGAKQICPNCQAKFYDLGRRPAVCPKCGTSFDPEEAVKNRRIRARTATPDYDAEDEKPVKAVNPDAEGFEDEPDETPELDEAAETETDVVDDDDDTTDPTPAPGGDDLGVDFAEEDEVADADEDDSVPFLEDEDEDFAEDEIDGIGEDDSEER